MSLSPIVGFAATQALNLFKNKVSPTPTAAPASSNNLAGTVDLSHAAQFFSKLQNLAQGNQAQFKQLTAQISSKLQAAAQKASGSQQTWLTELANQFQTASQTGSVNGLQALVSSHQSSIQSVYQQGSNTLQSILQQIPGL